MQYHGWARGHNDGSADTCQYVWLVASPEGGWYGSPSMFLPWQATSQRRSPVSVESATVICLGYLTLR